MTSDCVLSAEYDGCYYVAPAYSRRSVVLSPSHHGSDSSISIANATAISSHNAATSAGDDRSRLIGLISRFNTNNHGLLMTLVRKISHLLSSSKYTLSLRKNVPSLKLYSSKLYA